MNTYNWNETFNQFRKKQTKTTERRMWFFMLQILLLVDLLHASWNIYSALHLYLFRWYTFFQGHTQFPKGKQFYIRWQMDKAKMVQYINCVWVEWEAVKFSMLKGCFGIRHLASPVANSEMLTVTSHLSFLPRYSRLSSSS